MPKQILDEHFVERREGTRLLFRYEIPAQRSWGGIIFMGIWLLGWLTGEIAVGLILFGFLPGKGEGYAYEFFMWIWFVFWSFGGVAAIEKWREEIGYKEVIEISDYQLIIKRGAVIPWRKKSYDLHKVKEMESTHQGIQFMYEHTFVKFAVTIKKVERNILLEDMERFLPETALKKKTDS